MSQDKDELAKLLGEMAAGEHAEDEHAQAGHDDEVAHLAEPTPPPPAPAPPSKPTPPAPVTRTEPKAPPTPPRPAVKPIAPKAVAPPPKPAPTPNSPSARPAVKPALPPRPPPVVKPLAPPAPKPEAPPPTSKPLFTPSGAQTPSLPTPIPEPAPSLASTPIIADEEETERYSGTDDDAVIVPAVAATELAKPHAPLPRRQHLAQKLYFKQTIVPILLTLGLICLIVPILGLASSPYSPFKALAEIYFMATFWPLGVAFLVFGLLTMFSVKKELEHHAAQQSA